jgi:hypothetical protein
MLHVTTYWKLLMWEELCHVKPQAWALTWLQKKQKKKKLGLMVMEGPMGVMLMEELIGVMVMEWIMEGR